MNEAARIQQEPQHTPSLDEKLQGGQQSKRDRRKELLAELKAAEAELANINDELAPEDAKDAAYIANLFTQASDIAKKGTITMEDRGALKVILNDLNQVKSETGGLEKFDFEGQESSIDAAIANVEAWFETLHPIDDETMSYTRNLVDQAEALYTKDELTPDEIASLRVVKDDLTQVLNEHPNIEAFQFSGEDTALAGIIKKIELKTTTEQTKDTDEAAIDVLESQIDNMPSTATVEGTAELPETEQMIQYVQDRIDGQTPIWIQRTDGRIQKATATNYSEKDGRVTVMFEEDGQRKMKRPTLEQFMQWQEEEGGEKINDLVDIQPLEEAVKNETLSSKDHEQIHQEFVDFVESETLQGTEQAQIPNKEDLNAFATGLEALETEAGTANLESIPVSEVLNKVSVAEVNEELSQGFTSLKETTANNSTTETSSEEESLHEAFWENLTRMKEEIENITVPKTGALNKLFGRKMRLKFNGEVPADFNIFDPSKGLVLSNAEEMISALRASGQTEDADTVEHFEDLVIRLEKEAQLNNGSRLVRQGRRSRDKMRKNDFDIAQRNSVGNIKM